MESTSEVVWKEQTKSSVSQKCVQEVSSTSVQKLSSSSLVGEQQNVMSIMGSDGGLIGNQIVMKVIAPIENSLSLSSSPNSSSGEVGNNAINTTSVQSEFSAMKLKDDHGNEIGEIVEQKQQQQSVQASSVVTSTDCGSSSETQSATSSSKLKQSATTVIAEAQESSSSVSSSSFTSSKKQEFVSSSTRSLSSVKASESIEKVMKSSIVIAENQEF